MPNDDNARQYVDQWERKRGLLCVCGGNLQSEEMLLLLKMCGNQQPVAQSGMPLAIGNGWKQPNESKAAKERWRQGVNKERQQQ